MSDEELDRRRRGERGPSGSAVGSALPGDGESAPRARADRGAASAPSPPTPGRRSRRVEVPVLVVWGERDPFLAPHLAEPPPSLVPDVRVELVAGASHDVMLDAPERVNALLVEFLAAGRNPADRRTT